MHTCSGLEVSNPEKTVIMPTVLRIGPYRFFFYAGDRDEPPHMHVERDEQIAKFWLVPMRVQYTWLQPTETQPDPTARRGTSHPTLGELECLLS